MLRTTPLHLLFSDDRIDRRRLAELAREAAGSGKAATDLLAVSQLPAVSAWVTEIRPGDQDPHTVHAYSALVFYAMHTLGRLDGAETDSLWVVPESVARSLATEEEGTTWSERPPRPTGYAQLPQNVFWVETEAEGGEGFAEAVDGLFWVLDGDGLWVMLAAGVREGRPGFSAVTLDRIPAGDVGLWADASMRDSGPDFENTLPGGDLANFLTVASSGEMLKLLARVWRHAEVHGTTEVQADADEPSAEGVEGLSYLSLNPAS